MSKIIALMGRASSGKTTTIHKLPALLLASGYEQLPGNFKKHGTDFIDIYTKDGLKLGITSSGDTYKIVNERLTILVSAKCDIIICACRTSGGTHAAINNFKNYTSEFIQKTYASLAANEQSVNTTDANVIFYKI